MVELELGRWIVRLDKEKTKDFYDKFHFITDDCSCDYCVNYVKATAFLPQKLLNIFMQLGIDPRKEGKIYHCCDNENGTHLYGGFYHIIGELITGDDCWEKASDSTSNDRFLKMEDGYSIGFTRDVALVPDNYNVQ